MGNERYCHALTTSDQISRFILGCEALESTQQEEAIRVFERMFLEYGLPWAIRSDNGVPFATTGIFGLSRLSVYWLRLGIRLERIQPGHPEQNGRHERMHRTLKETTTKPPGKNILQQQEMFDAFVNTYNNERPHEGLEMATPSVKYRSSERVCPQILPEPNYPEADEIAYITQCGTIYLGGRQKVFVGESLGGQLVGLNEVEEGIWKVQFMDYDLGYFDKESCKFSRGPNPFLTNNL